MLYNPQNSQNLPETLVNGAPTDRSILDTEANQGYHLKVLWSEVFSKI